MVYLYAEVGRAPDDRFFYIRKRESQSNKTPRSGGLCQFLMRACLLTLWLAQFSWAGSDKALALTDPEWLRQSASRAGMPCDSNRSRSFFTDFVKETIDWNHMQTRHEARQKIFYDIEGFSIPIKLKTPRLLEPIQYSFFWNHSLREYVV